MIYVKMDTCPHCRAFEPAWEAFCRRSPLLPRPVECRALELGSAAEAALRDLHFPGYVPYLAFASLNAAGEVAHAWSYRGPLTAAAVEEFARHHLRAAPTV